MYEFLISTAIVALAEMGDKTQLLALLLAARFRNLLQSWLLFYWQHSLTTDFLEF